MADGGRMRAAVLAGPGQIRIDELALPEPGPGQMRVRLEGWGVVDAVGENVGHVTVGDRVAALSYKS